MTTKNRFTIEKEVKILSEARKFLDAALVEFEEGVKKGKDEAIRNAAEKAWNAIIQATAALLLAKGFDEENIKIHRQKRLTLEELSVKDDKIRNLGIREIP